MSFPSRQTDRVGMAIDVLFVVHLPMAAQAEIAPDLFRVASMPKVPTISEEVWIAGTSYFQVNRVLYREDTRVELHFSNQGLYGGWSVEATQAAHDALTGAGWSDQSPWDAAPETPTDEPQTPADPTAPTDPEPEPTPEPESDSQQPSQG